MMRNLRVLCATLLLAIGVSTANAKTLAIGYTNESSQEAAAMIFKIVFERSGYNVAEKIGSTSTMLHAVADGEVDVFISAWLPNRDAEDYESLKDKLVLMTPIYDDARSGFAVPKYIPKSIVENIDDLTKPEVLERINKTITQDTREKELNEQTKNAGKTYSLADQGFAMEALDSDSWFATVEKRLESKEWFVIPITKPHIFNLTKNFRFLKDPKGGFHKKDTAWLVANKKTEKEVAEHIYNILLKMEMSTEWVAELQQMIKEKDYPPYVAARIWMAAHPYTVEYWISGE